MKYKILTVLSKVIEWKDGEIDKVKLVGEIWVHENAIRNNKPHISNVIYTPLSRVRVKELEETGHSVFKRVD